MPRWSTTGVAQVIKLVIIPLFGAVTFLLEQQRDSPRPLLVGASLILIGVLPASYFEGRFFPGRGPDVPPTAPTGPTQPPILPPTPPVPPPAGPQDGASTP